MIFRSSRLCNLYLLESRYTVSFEQDERFLVENCISMDNYELKIYHITEEVLAGIIVHLCFS